MRRVGSCARCTIHRMFASVGWIEEFLNLPAKHRRRCKAEDERGGIIRIDQALVDASLDEEGFVFADSHIAAFGIERQGVVDLSGSHESEKADARGEQHGCYTSRSTLRARLQALIVHWIHKRVLDDENVQRQCENAWLEIEENVLQSVAPVRSHA